ncbi:MAG: hypothetical protein H0U32_09280 [Thermoleophilaceae bacterium]|nr:hypothetical protein [Thermoleophilaceae bacterium]
MLRRARFALDAAGDCRVWLGQGTGPRARRGATEYLSGWTGYALIAAGLLFFVPVVVSIGRLPSSRLYPRSRNAYSAWGACLYVLGFAIASQVAAVMNLHPVP